MPSPAYESQVKRALLRQFESYKVAPPDEKTMECLKKLALLLIRDEETTPSAVMAAHVIVPNYLYEDWVFHDLFTKCIIDCLADRPCVLGLDLTEAADSFLDESGKK